MVNYTALDRLEDEMHAFRPLATTPPHQLVAEQFREQIRLGWWPVGHRLPPERELATELNVSRETIRQAVRLLTEEGVVVPTGPRTTPTVAEPTPTDGDGALHELQLRAREYEDLHALRILIESHTASRAAVKHRQEHMALMIKAQGNMRTALAMDRPDLFRAADSDFHLAVAAAAMNEPLLVEVRRIRGMMLPVLDQLMGPQLENSLKEHEDILQAIQDKDGPRAGEYMKSHLQHSGGRLKSLLSGETSTPSE